MCHDSSPDDADPIAADLARLPDSIHGQMGIGCVDCHVDLADAELPHADELEPADCSMCHDGIVDDMVASVHSTVEDLEGAPVTCAACHGVHDIRPRSDRSSPTYLFNVPATCAVCHGGHSEDGAIKATNGDPARVGGDFADGIHGHALLVSGLNVAPNCATCHGAHRILSSKDPASRTHRSRIPSECGSCHEGVLTPYRQSVHGVKNAEGETAVAVCTDCHAAHLINQADVESWRLDVVRECGGCHEQSVVSFRDTFHGKVTSLGFARVAKCADCHGFHDIRPIDDPESRLSEANLVATCETCHTESSAQFVKYQPHPEPENVEASAPLYYSTKFMHYLLMGVFTFFFVHTALWLPRSWISRRKHRRQRAAEKSANQPQDDDDDGDPDAQ